MGQFAMKIKALEEENYKLFSRNKQLEEEILRINLDLNSERCQLIKEKEVLMQREGTLKDKEKRVKKKEGEL